MTVRRPQSAECSNIDSLGEEQNPDYHDRPDCQADVPTKLLECAIMHDDVERRGSGCTDGRRRLMIKVELKNGDRFLVRAELEVGQSG